MTRDELLAMIKVRLEVPDLMKLHKPLLVKDYENDTDWYECQERSGNGFSAHYPCETIKIIEKELG